MINPGSAGLYGRSRMDVLYPLASSKYRQDYFHGELFVPEQPMRQYLQVWKKYLLCLFRALQSWWYAATSQITQNVSCLICGAAWTKMKEKTRQNTRVQRLQGKNRLIFVLKQHVPCVQMIYELKCTKFRHKFAKNQVQTRITYFSQTNGRPGTEIK